MKTYKQNQKNIQNSQFKKKEGNLKPPLLFYPDSSSHHTGSFQSAILLGSLYHAIYQFLLTCMLLSYHTNKTLYCLFLYMFLCAQGWKLF